MSEDLNKYTNTNIEILRMYVNNNIRLQIGMDILKPIIKEYSLEYPNALNGNCSDCIIDMLRWAIKESKETFNDKLDKVSKKIINKHGKTNS